MKLSVPITFNIDGELVKGDVSLSDDATPEQVEAFKEIQYLHDFNKRQYDELRNPHQFMVVKDRNKWEPIR